MRLFSLPFQGIRTRWTSFRLTAALIERSYPRCFVQSLQMKPRSQKTVLARRFPPLMMMHSTGLNCIAVISHFHSLSLCLRLSFCETHTQKVCSFFSRDKQKYSYRMFYATSFIAAVRDGKKQSPFLKARYRTSLSNPYLINNSNNKKNPLKEMSTYNRIKREKVRLGRRQAAAWRDSRNQLSFAHIFLRIFIQCQLDTTNSYLSQTLR